MADPRIIPRTLVLVADHKADGRARGPALEQARQQLHPVRLAPRRGRQPLPRTPQIHLALDQLRRQRHPSRAAVHHAAQPRAMRLPERRQPEHRPKRTACHSVLHRRPYHTPPHPRPPRGGEAWGRCACPRVMSLRRLKGTALENPALGGRGGAPPRPPRMGSKGTALGRRRLIHPREHAPSPGFRPPLAGWQARETGYGGANETPRSTAMKTAIFGFAGRGRRVCSGRWPGRGRWAMRGRWSRCRSPGLSRW
jgi:hypothetical protein